MPPGLTYCEFQVESKRQTGITYQGHEGRGITQAAYGAYIAHHNLKAKMGKPSTDFEVLPSGTIAQLASLKTDFERERDQKRKGMLILCDLWQNFPDARDAIERVTGQWFAWGQIRVEWEWRTDAEIAEWEATRETRIGF